MAKRTFRISRDDNGPVAVDDMFQEESNMTAAQEQAILDQQAAADAVAAMHADPDLDPDAAYLDDATVLPDGVTTALNGVPVGLTARDLALTPAETVAHLAAMREADPRQRGVRPVSGLAPSQTAHTPGPMAPHPAKSINDFADRAEQSMKDRIAQRAARDAKLREEAENETAEMRQARLKNAAGNTGNKSQGNRADAKGNVGSTAKPRAEAQPKAPKTGICLFSGETTGGGRFRPGYDAKLKGALIKAFRGQTPDLSAASDELRERFANGDLSTDEGLMNYAVSLGWGQYLTTVTKTVAERTEKKVAKSTPDAVLDSIVDALMRLDLSEGRKMTLAGSFDDLLRAAIREEATERANEPTVKDLMTEAGIDPSLNELTTRDQDRIEQQTEGSLPDSDDSIDESDPDDAL